MNGAQMGAAPGGICSGMLSLCGQVSWLPWLCAREGIRLHPDVVCLSDEAGPMQLVEHLAC